MRWPLKLHVDSSLLKRGVRLLLSSEIESAGGKRPDEKGNVPKGGAY